MRIAARYWVQKLNARRLDVELPMPAADCLVNVWLDHKRITNWTPLDSEPTKAHIPIQPNLYGQPCLLELEYKLPAGFASGGFAWGTTLHAPQFRGEAMVGNVRWQIGLPLARVGLVPQGNLSFHWSVGGWLLEPEAALAGGDMDLWREANLSGLPVTIALSQNGQDSVAPLSLSTLTLAVDLFGRRAADRLGPVRGALAALAVLARDRRLDKRRGGNQFARARIDRAFGVRLRTRHRGLGPCAGRAMDAARAVSPPTRLSARFQAPQGRLIADSHRTGKRREPSTIDAPTPAAVSAAPSNHGLTKGS